jgi:putative MATE family efflux protein
MKVISTIEKDLTIGSVRSQLIRYSVPIMTTSLLQAVYGIVDMLIVSRLLGDAGASAVNNANQITFMITNVAIGLSNGGSILVGQYFGKKDKLNTEKTIGTFMTLFACIGAVVAVAFFFLTPQVVTWLRAPAYEETFAYLRVSAWGFFAIFLYNMLASGLRAMGNSKVPLYCILAATVANIGLDLLFVGPCGLGTGGAALATIIAQYLSVALALGFMLRNRGLFSFSRAYLRPDRDKMRLILKVGVPCAIQWTVASISWLTVTWLINAYGTVFSAASGISAKIRDLSHVFILAMSTGTGTMIAQTLGARKYDRAKEVLYTAMKLSIVIALVGIGISVGFAPGLAGLFTDDPQVIRYAALNLRIEMISELWYAIFMIYHSLMTGAGHTRTVLFSSFTNCILVRVPLSIILNSLFGVVGIYVACALAPIISIPIGIWYTKSNRWRTTMVDET